MYMNEHDVVWAYDKARRDNNKIKAEAIQILSKHIEIVNANSDGWAYWRRSEIIDNRPDSLRLGLPSK